MNPYGDASPSRDQPLGSWRDHIAWIVALVPVTIAIIRIFFVSSGGGNVLAELARTLNVTSLAVSTVVALLPVLAGWVTYFAWILVARSNESADREKFAVALIAAISSTIFMLIIWLFTTWPTVVLLVLQGAILVLIPWCGNFSGEARLSLRWHSSLASE
jgi:hypothetical protein